jgi:hypothetical protein
VPIDACSSTFAELATTVLPGYMAVMQKALEHPYLLNEFCKPGIGPKGILSNLGLSQDFSGCYVLLHSAQPFYVGISRKVITRLRQHSTGKTHYDASLAYGMATEKVPHKKTRGDAMRDPAFRRAFKEAQDLLGACAVSFIEIRNPLEIYLFEAYSAMALDTCEWNTFRTH